METTDRLDIYTVERDTTPMPDPGMDTFTAVMIAEGVEEADEATTIEAWQLLVDTGMAWKLQGWFGRTATALIEEGIIEQRSN